MPNDNIGLIYVNLTIHDGKEAVKEKVAKKIGKSNLPAPLKKIAAVHAPQAASDFATPDTMVKMMSKKMRDKLPKKMWEKGLTVEIQEVFRQANYVVLQLQVTHVDSIALAEASAGIESKDEDEESRCFICLKWLRGLMGVRAQRKLESDVLPKLVMQGLATEMPKMLEEKLANKRIDAETKVLKEADQARYFFQKYQVFQEERQAKKMRNPAYRLKKKITPEMDMSDSSDEDDNEN